MGSLQSINLLLNISVLQLHNPRQKRKTQHFSLCVFIQWENPMLRTTAQLILSSAVSQGW